MMREESNNEGGTSPTASPTKGGGANANANAIADGLMKDDVEAAAFIGDDSESKGKTPGGSGEEITLEKLKVRFLAMAEYLKQELSTMDAQKAKHLSWAAKEKAVIMALAFKALMIQYLQELKQLDKEKAKALGLKYQGKAKELSATYAAKTVEVAGVARRKAIEVANELKTIDKTQAKQRSIDMVRKGKVVVKDMPQGTKIKYGIMFLILFVMMSGVGSGGGGGGSHENVKHKHLCYIHETGNAKTAACEKMLTGVTKGYTNWIFIGNEPIFALFRPFHDHFGLKEDQVLQKARGDRGKRRKVQFYYHYDLPDEEEWNKKYKDQKNPTEIFAAEGIGRSDCGHCPMVKLEGKHKDVVVENLLVETSRDVSQVTTETSTTQETVARYLGQHYANQQKKTACVVQQGTYEMTKAPWRTTQEFTDFTKDFHDKLEQHCGILIRIGNFGGSDKELKQKVKDWNAGARDVTLNRSKNGYFIDVSQVGTPSMDGYITPVWEMFKRLSKVLER